MNHENSQKDKFVKLSGWGKPKGHPGGKPKGHTRGKPKVSLFYINIGELEGIKGLFPR